MAGQTILIVEDDPDIRDGVRILLSGEGYHILEAENGLRALELFNPEVDLVILDIMMPGMSGLRVCEELRKSSTVPILFLTAKSQEAHGVRLALDCNRVWVDEREVDLTETEYKILRLLMQNPQRIYSIQVIYETVWNEPYYYVAKGTVMVHIRNLRMKVEDDPQKPARICTVWGKGYRFAAGEEGRL